MALHDLEVIGMSAGNREHRVAASATIAEVGEPIESTATLSSGVANSNTVVIAPADTPVIGTDNFLGICAKQFEVDSAGTVTAHKTQVTVPIPWVSVIRGKAETAASVDTDTELLGILFDVTLIDRNATGASDGGELFTIKEVVSSNTSGLTIINGNIDKGTLDVVVDVRAFRATIS